MWLEKDGALYRRIDFKDFVEAFSFMASVAKVAEEQGHHPKWTNDYNKVEIWLSSHDKGNKITEKDKKLAAAIDAIYGI